MGSKIVCGRSGFPLHGRAGFPLYSSYVSLYVNGIPIDDFFQNLTGFAFMRSEPFTLNEIYEYDEEPKYPGLEYPGCGIFTTDKNFTYYHSKCNRVINATRVDGGNTEKSCEFIGNWPLGMDGEDGDAMDSYKANIRYSIPDEAQTTFGSAYEIFKNSIDDRNLVSGNFLHDGTYFVVVPCAIPTVLDYSFEHSYAAFLRSYFEKYQITNARSSINCGAVAKIIIENSSIKSVDWMQVVSSRNGMKTIDPRVDSNMKRVEDVDIPHRMTASALDSQWASRIDQITNLDVILFRKYIDHTEDLSHEIDYSSSTIKSGMCADAGFETNLPDLSYTGVITLPLAFSLGAS